MAGGATGGYCAIGSCVIATPPITMMNSAITHAKIGRSMKNLAMRGASGSAAAGGGCGGRPPRRRAAGGRRRSGAVGRRGCGAGVPRHRLHRRARPIIFWKPSTITCSPAFRPSSTTHWLPCAAPILSVRGAACRRHRPPSRCRPAAVRVTACCGSRMRLAAAGPAPAARARTGRAAAGPSGLGTSARSVTWPVVGSTVRSENSSLPGVRYSLPSSSTHPHRAPLRRPARCELAAGQRAAQCSAPRSPTA